MNIKQRLLMMVLPFVMLIPSISNADVVVELPALDIQNLGGDLGVTLDGTSFTINATAFAIVTGGGASIDITDVPFVLTGAGSFDGFIGSFDGTFSVGSLLSGTFTGLNLLSFMPGQGQFDANLVYTGGSLQGGLSGGTILGVFDDNFTDVVAKVGQVAVVPVPAAAWLFGSGLIGLAGIARRKA